MTYRYLCCERKRRVELRGPLAIFTLLSEYGNSGNNL